MTFVILCSTAISTVMSDSGSKTFDDFFDTGDSDDGIGASSVPPSSLSTDQADDEPTQISDTQVGTGFLLDVSEKKVDSAAQVQIEKSNSDSVEHLKRKWEVFKEKHDATGIVAGDIQARGADIADRIRQANNAGSQEVRLGSGERLATIRPTTAQREQNSARKELIKSICRGYFIEHMPNYRLAVALEGLGGSRSESHAMASNMLQRATAEIDSYFVLFAGMLNDTDSGAIRRMVETEIDSLYGDEIRADKLRPFSNIYSTLVPGHAMAVSSVATMISDHYGLDPGMFEDSFMDKTIYHKRVMPIVARLANYELRGVHASNGSRDVRKAQQNADNASIRVFRSRLWAAIGTYVEAPSGYGFRGDVRAASALRALYTGPY